jgi:N-acetylneuraminic acid mutarotase
MSRALLAASASVVFAGFPSLAMYADVPFRVTWSLGAPMPQYRKGGVAGAVDGQLIYAAGMQHPWREPDDVLAYDPAAGTWEFITPMPASPSYTSGTSTGEALYVLGGRNADGRCFRLRREDGQWVWTELPSLSQPRVVAAVAVVGDLLIAAGGGWGMKYGAFDPTPVTIVEGLNLTQPDLGWRTLPHYPGIDRPGAFGACAGGRFYVFGGYRCMQDGMTAPDGFVATHLCPRLADAYCFDPATAIWRRIADLPLALSGGAAVTYQDRYIILLGGSHMSTAACEFRFEGEVISGYNDRVYVYDTLADQYTQLEDRMPAGLNDIKACIIGDTIYAAGGESIDKRTSNTVNLLQIGRVEER